MSTADWIVCAITTLLVIVLGGLPEQVTGALVDRIATHKAIPVERVGRVDQSHTMTSALDMDIVGWFNQGIFLGRVSRIYLPADPHRITIHLQNPEETYQLFLFRNEVGVVRRKGRRIVFYFIRSADLAAHFHTVASDTDVARPCGGIHGVVH